METTKKLYMTFTNDADNMEASVWENKSSQLPYSVTLKDLDSGEMLKDVYRYRNATDAMKKAQRLVYLTV